MLLLSRQFASLAEKCRDSQPSSVWIFWVPILVRGLADESLRNTCKSILLKLTSTFPQAVYFPLQSIDSAAALEVLESLKAERPEMHAAFELFSSKISQAFASSDFEVQRVARCLDDLRFKRTSIAEVRVGLPAGLVKGEPTEVALVRWLKAQDVLEKSSLLYVTDLGISPSDFNAKLAGLIEMPGNYSRFVSVPMGSSLESMSTVRVSGLDYRVSEVQGAYGIVKKISLLGNNGLWYCFSVEPGRAEGGGIGELLYAVANTLCSKSAQSKQRNVKLSCLQSIPLGPDCFLREHLADVESLEAVFGGAEAVEQSVAEVKKVGGSEKAAFTAMQNSVGDNLLVEFVNASSAEEFYANAKRFSKTFAAAGIVNYLLGVDASSRSLNDFLLSKKQGSMILTGFDLFKLARASEANNGHAVPFRLTRNVVNLIGQRNMAGLVPAVMRAVADAINKELTPVMELAELLSLCEHVDLNLAEGISERARDLVGDDEDSEDSGSVPTNPFTRISELIDGSMDPANLSSVQPKHFLPWF